MLFIIYDIDWTIFFHCFLSFHCFTVRLHILLTCLCGVLIFHISWTHIHTHSLSHVYFLFIYSGHKHEVYSFLTKRSIFNFKSLILYAQPIKDSELTQVRKSDRLRVSKSFFMSTKKRSSAALKISGKLEITDRSWRLMSWRRRCWRVLWRWAVPFLLHTGPCCAVGSAETVAEPRPSTEAYYRAVSTEWV